MELRPFATLTLAVASDGLYMLGATPAGTRIVQEINEARIEGPRLSASLVGHAAADWLAIDAQGVGTFDIRMTLMTDDGAPIYLAYKGRADWSTGMGKAPVYVGMEFEAGDERYRWLNALHLFGRGQVGEGGKLIYEIYEPF
jgi:hypothetical protein